MLAVTGLDKAPDEVIKVELGERCSEEVKQRAEAAAVHASEKLVERSPRSVLQ